DGHVEADDASRDAPRDAVPVDGAFAEGRHLSRHEARAEVAQEILQRHLAVEDVPPLLAVPRLETAGQPKPGDDAIRLAQQPLLVVEGVGGRLRRGRRSELDRRIAGGDRRRARLARREPEQRERAELLQSTLPANAWP